MVSLYDGIKTLMNQHINNVLLVAQSSLPEHQFLGFKKFLLNEFGDRGLGKELKQLLDKQNGMGRNGQE